MNVWPLSRPNATEAIKLKCQDTEKRGFFYWVLHLIFKHREKNVMEEEEVSKPFNIPKLFENKLNIPLYAEAHF
jgi:hypothetical protein